MKQRFQRVDVFDLDWLDDEELEALQWVMLSNREIRFVRFGCAR